MISSSPVMKLAALLLAAGVHAALALVLMSSDPVAMEGAPGSAEVQLGSSFADMVAGVVTSNPAGERVEVGPAPEVLSPEPADPVPPEPAERPASVEPRSSAMPRPAKPARPVEATRPGPGQVAERAAAAPTTSPLPPVRADRLRPVSAIPAPAEAKPLNVEATPAETVDGPDTADTAPLDRSPRPVMRSRATKTTAKPKAKIQTKRATARQETAPQGNSDRNARAGATSGSRKAMSRAAGSGGSDRRASGNAAARNYPGVIMSCVSRAGRPNVRGRGTARVSFSVSGNGRITGVSLARGSGNSALDRAAVRLIAGVGMCPPPPPGAQRRFSISLSAR